VISSVKADHINNQGFENGSTKQRILCRINFKNKTKQTRTQKAEAGESPV
jgi:hypothetical protein